MPPRRTLALLGVVLVALNLRIAVATLSPVLDAVRRDVPLTTAQVGLLGSVPVLAFAVLGLATPALAGRVGLERAVVLAVLVAGAGEVARATSSGPASFLVWSGVALAGLGAGNVLLPALVKQWFPTRIGPVTAVYAVCLSVSTAVPPLLAVPLTQAWGWRWAAGVWAVLAVAAGVPWLVLGRAPGRAGHEPRPRGEAVPLRRLVRSPLAWAAAVAFGMNSGVTYVLLAWLPAMLVDAGLPSGATGAWLALFAIMGLPTGLVAPVLAGRRRNPVGVVGVIATCFAAGVAGLGFAPTSATAVWVVLAGLGSGTFPLLLALLGLRTRTADGAAALSGFAQGTGYALAGAAPVAVGVLREETGTWGAGTVLLLACLATLVVAASVVCRPRLLEDEPPFRTAAGGRRRAR